MQLHQPISPMLLESSPRIPTDDRIYFVKLNGFRTIFSYKRGHGVKIFTRHQNDVTLKFIELQVELPVKNVLLDGETIVLQQGKEDLSAVLQRIRSKKSLHQTLPANLLLFDILMLDDEPLIRKPLIERMALLNQIKLPQPLGLCPIHSNGHELFEATKQLGMEGICAKRPNSPYLIGKRSDAWVKIKHILRMKSHIIAFRTHPFRILITFENHRQILRKIPYSYQVEIYKLPRISPPPNSEWHYLRYEIPCEIKHYGFTSNGLLQHASLERFLPFS